MLVTCLSQYQFITIQFFSRYSKLNKKPNLVISLVNINNVLKKYIYTFYKKQLIGEQTGKNIITMNINDVIKKYIFTFYKKKLISEQTGKILSQCMFYNKQYKFIAV